MNKKIVIAVLGIAVLVGGWSLFRPEKLFVQKAVDEAKPANVQSVLASGRFHGIAHESRGAATVYQLSDGRRVVRLSEFETSNGPDLMLFMVAAGDANDSESVKTAGYVTLGSLKGNTGDQNYELPADVDLAKYQSVTVWCNRFGVNFATAPLTAEAR